MLQIIPQQLREWVTANKDFLLVDIREDWEHDAYNIGGLHIPMGQVMARMAELPRDKDIVMYCEKGIRSTITIQRLEQAGYHNIYNLNGGMYAWKALL
jgi:rhodanese-related sulfurtransferase